MGHISKWTTTSSSDAQTEVWSVISNPSFAVKNNSAKAIFNWSYNWTISEVLECLNRNPQLELIVHDINGLAAVSLPHILKDLKTKAGHIFCLQDKKTFTQEKRFEIATFFGEQSLLRNNPNKKLRELYKYWSYVVILSKEGLSAGQAALLDSEKHLAPSSSVLSEHHAWIKAIENLLAEGYAEGAEIPRVAKSARDAKSLLKALAKKFLKPRGATNKSQDLSFTKVLDFPEIKKPDPRQWSKVLITGWYGTETAGDKAKMELENMMLMVKSFPDPTSQKNITSNYKLKLKYYNLRFLRKYEFRAVLKLNIHLNKYKNQISLSL